MSDECEKAARNRAVERDQLECTDPACSDFLEPAGDSTHLVHCKERPRG